MGGERQSEYRRGNQISTTSQQPQTQQREGTRQRAPHPSAGPPSTLTSPINDEESDLQKLKDLFSVKFQHLTGRVLNAEDWRTFCRRLEAWTYVIDNLSKKRQTDRQGKASNAGWQRRL